MKDLIPTPLQTALVSEDGNILEQMEKIKAKISQG
jgi:negative regulator of sigma E activity